MKIKSVEMMRSIRSQLSTEIEGMDWKKEDEYLKCQIKTFEFLTKPIPDQAHKYYEGKRKKEASL